jgi:hypothetical protein
MMVMTQRASILLTNCISGQNNKTDKYFLDNNYYNNNYDEIAYPFSKIIKLKHDPEAKAAQENKPVQYTVDIALYRVGN